MTVEPVPGELEGVMSAVGQPVVEARPNRGAGACAPLSEGSAATEATGRLLTGPFVVLWLCGWTYFLGIGAVNPLLPLFVKDHMGESDVVVGLVVALMALSAVVVRPFAGRLANRRGRRMVTTAGATVLAASLALYPFPSLAILVPARLLTGVAEALFFTAAATMVTELAPAHRRGEAVSYFSVAVYLGTGLGPAVGSWVSSLWSIRLGFLAAAAFAVVAAMISRFLVETEQGARATGSGRNAGRISTVALLPGCVLALGMVANVAFASFMPLYAAQLRTGVAGVYLTYTVVVILVRLLGARIPDVLGPSKCGSVATVLIAAGMAAISLSGTVWGLYVGAATLGVGISFLYPALMKLVVDRAADTARAAAVATFTAFFDVASGVGGLAVGIVASAGGYRASFAAAGASAFTGLVVLKALALRAAPGDVPAQALRADPSDG
ncbi:MAG TPA: MFS transporter [Acidimicrobiales bacterium]|nr:MFS transporter [Acidimicrobiales bacterium]